MAGPSGPAPGGCRAIASGGCLLGLAALCAAAAAFIAGLFILFWIVQFVFSLL